MVLRVKCLGYIDQRQTSVLPYSLCRTTPRGGGGGGPARKGLVEVCRRGLQTLTQFLRLRMTEKHIFFNTSQKKSNNRPAKFN